MKNQEVEALPKTVEVPRGIEAIKNELKKAVEDINAAEKIGKASDSEMQEKLDLVHALEIERDKKIKDRVEEVKAEIENRQRALENLGDSPEYTEYGNIESTKLEDEILELQKELSGYGVVEKSISAKTEKVENSKMEKREVKEREVEPKYEADKEYQNMLEDACLRWHMNSSESRDYFMRNRLTFDVSPDGYLMDFDGKETNTLPSQIDPAEMQVQEKVKTEFFAKHPEYSAQAESLEVGSSSEKVPGAVKEKDSGVESEKNIRACKSLEELFGVLKELGSIEGSKDTFSADELEVIIKSVVNEGLSLNYVTRSLGLRETVETILSKAKTEEEVVPKENARDLIKEQVDERSKLEKQKAQALQKKFDATTPEMVIQAEKEIDEMDEKLSKLNPEDLSRTEDLKATKEGQTEKVETMEDLSVNLDAMRMRYMAENKKYLESRKTKGLIGGLWQKLRGIKPEEEKALPEELIAAKENLDKAKIAVGKKMLQDEKVRLEQLGTNSEELVKSLEAYKSKEVFEKVVLDEHDLLEKFRQETWPPKERGVFFKALQWYGKQNRITKLAIGTMVAAGGAAIGGMSAPATALFAGSYLARGALATGVGLLAGKGFEKLVKDKSGENFSNAVEKMRKDFGGGQVDYKTVESYFRNASETRKKEENKYNLAKNLVIGAAAAWTNVGLSSLEAYISKLNTPIYVGTDNPTPSPVPDSAPVEPAPSEVIVEIPTAPVDAVYSHIVGPRDNMWTILKSDMSQNVPGFNSLSKAAQNNAIDILWQKFVHADPAQLKAIGIASGDPHILANGANIKVGEMIDQDMMTKAVSHATKLTASQIASLNHDTSVLHSALKNYKGPIREGLVNKILASKR